MDLRPEILKIRRFRTNIGERQAVERQAVQSSSFSLLLTKPTT